MRKFKIVCCAAIAAVVAMSAAACSVVENVTEDVTEVSSASSSEAADVKNVDKNIEAPAFNRALSSITTATDCAVTLDGTATVSDGGTITYQWYVNNVESNGGGTAIEGATEATYTVPTQETGIKFYYVVASNNMGDSLNMSTGNVCKIEVIQRGDWSVDEFGGARFLAADGSYPANKIVYIDGNSYLFNESGYLCYGWTWFNNKYYYSDEEGKLLIIGTTPEGYHTDEYGAMMEYADPLGLGVNNPPAEETTGEEAAAEETTAEEAPAEETTAEEAPAEESTESTES